MKGQGSASTEMDTGQLKHLGHEFYVSANEKVFGGNGEVVSDTNNVNTLDSLSN